MEFDWDDANILHLARHDITPDEVEQVIENEPVLIDAYSVDGELRYTEVGETDRARILTVISTERGSKLRVLTGWDAARNEKQKYLRAVAERFK